MLIPIGDDNVNGGYKPIVSYAILLINIAVFIFQINLDDSALDVLITQLGAIPQLITSGQSLHCLITSMFLHGGIMHIVGNMLFLWIFADNIEAIIGNWRFLLFYMLGGIMAMVAQCFLNPNSQIPCVGASGAIAAVLGAYFVMFPKSNIKMLLFFFIPFRLPALLFLGIWIAMQLYSGYSSLQVTEGSESGGVAWWAHIGGFVVGALVGLTFREKVEYSEQT